MNYVKLIRPVIRNLLRSERTPIITAGTGLYLNSLLSPPKTGDIPPQLTLRRQLNTLKLESLQNKLQNVAPAKWQSMNHSDRYNPRRLIRAIEVALVPSSANLSKASSYSCLSIGLTAPKSIIDSRIEKRVIARATPQFTKEVKILAKTYSDFASLPAATASGYREWLEYINRRSSLSQALSLWQLHERQYARRQLTWLKKIPQIHWFDITSPNWQKSVVTLMETCYS